MKLTHWALMVSTVGSLATGWASAAEASADAQAWWCWSEQNCWPGTATGDATGQPMLVSDWSVNNYSGETEAEVLRSGDWACRSDYLGAPVSCDRLSPSELRSPLCPSDFPHAFQAYDGKTLCYTDAGVDVVEWYLNYYAHWDTAAAIVGDFYASAWLGFAPVSGQVREGLPELEAFPSSGDVPLLDALNYWDAGDIASFLGVTSATADAIVKNRIQNGGVFYGLNEVNVPGFAPASYRNNSVVQSEADLHSLLAPQVAYNNKTTLYIDGSDQLNAMVDLIDSADKFIHLNMMLFFNDPYADLISEALRDAALRGVIVRVMYDYTTTNLASTTRDSGEAVAGTPITPGLGARDIILSGCIDGVACDVRSTSQETEFWDNYTVPGYDHWYDFETCWWGSCWTVSTGERTHLARAGVPEYMLEMQDYIQDSVETALNVVNHQKYMIVDGTKMMFGSSNFGGNYQYEGEVHSVKWKWHDGLSIVEGPAVAHAQRVFAQQWFVNARGDIFDFENEFYSPSDATLLAAADGTAPMALMLSFPGDPKHINIRHITDLVTNSEGDVYMTNPYPTDGEYWSALNSMSSERASRTHLVSSIGLTDGPTVGATIRCRGIDAATNGFSVYDYYQGEQFSHLKLTVDVSRDMVHYGSYNFNMRSKRHDLEFNFLSRDADLAERSTAVIQGEISNSGSAKTVDYYHTDNTWEPECIAERATNWGT